MEARAQAGKRPKLGDAKDLGVAHGSRDEQASCLEESRALTGAARQRQLKDPDFRRAEYYRLKLGLHTQAQIDRCCQDYLDALCWTQKLQKGGVPSWDWHYPHHYAPLAMDIATAPLKLPRFQLGEPLPEHIALLCVLPRSSARFLPEGYESLIQEGGALAEFFPDSCKIDRNGKRHDYEAVILLPWMDMRKLCSVLDAAR